MLVPNVGQARPQRRSRLNSVANGRTARAARSFIRGPPNHRQTRTDAALRPFESRSALGLSRGRAGRERARRSARLDDRLVSRRQEERRYEASLPQWPEAPESPAVRREKVSSEREQHGQSNAFGVRADNQTAVVGNASNPPASGLARETRNGAFSVLLRELTPAAQGRE